MGLLHSSPAAPGLGLRPWLPLAVSAALHALLFVSVLAHLVSTPSLPLPVGVWVEMAPNGPADWKPRPVARAVPSPLNLPSEKKAPAAETLKPAVIGNTDKATGLSGPIGDPNGVAASARERYLYELEAFLNQKKVYPPRARLLGQSGTVEVAFHVHPDGSLTDPHVVRPCIHDLLNRSAVDLIASAGRFRPLPNELGSDALHVTVPIAYELN